MESSSRFCSHQPQKLVTWPGTLSSSVTDETNCGSPQSPWVIEGAPGQRIDLSVVNFGWTASTNNQTTGGACQLFGHIIERSLNINRSLCGGSARESHVYTSMSNVIEVHILPIKDRINKASFLIKYSGKFYLCKCGMEKSNYLQSEFIFIMEYFDFCFLNFGIRALRYISIWNT